MTVTWCSICWCNALCLHFRTDWLTVVCVDPQEIAVFTPSESSDMISTWADLIFYSSWSDHKFEQTRHVNVLSVFFCFSEPESCLSPLSYQFFLFLITSTLFPLNRRTSDDDDVLRLSDAFCWTLLPIFSPHFPWQKGEARDGQWIVPLSTGLLFQPFRYVCFTEERHVCVCMWYDRELLLMFMSPFRVICYACFISHWENEGRGLQAWERMLAVGVRSVGRKVWGKKKELEARKQRAKNSAILLRKKK